MEIKFLRFLLQLLRRDFFFERSRKDFIFQNLKTTSATIFFLKRIRTSRDFPGFFPLNHWNIPDFSSKILRNIHSLNIWNIRKWSHYPFVFFLNRIEINILFSNTTNRNLSNGTFIWNNPFEHVPLYYPFELFKL